MQNFLLVVAANVPKAMMAAGRKCNRVFKPDLAQFLATSRQTHNTQGEKYEKIDVSMENPHEQFLATSR